MRSLRSDDRGVSIAVTHVLTLGITAVLITGLMLGAGSLLETERERSAEGSLETIGERLSGELSSVDRIASDGDTVTLRTTHPQRVASSTYKVELHDDCGGTDPDAPLIDDGACLELTADDEDVTVFVPVSVAEDDLADSEARGGTIEIEYDGGEITITNP